MDDDPEHTIDTLRVEDFDQYIDQLAELYHEAVINGAVLSQDSTFTIDQAYDYWNSLRDDFQEKRKHLLAS